MTAWVEQLADSLQPVLDLPLVRRTRRNHGLEHATIHLLANRVKNLRMAGRSDGSGFVLMGEAPTEAIDAAVRDALRRMRNGEHQLAVHPNCGTNLVTTGMMTSAAALLGLAGANRRDVFNRFPTLMILMIAALIFSQPLGLSLQKYITTDGDPADLEIIRITRSEMRTPFSANAITVHRVTTRSS